MTKAGAVLPARFDAADEETAGPSTSLRSGRDDNFVWQGCESPGKIVIPKKVTNSQDDGFVGVVMKNSLKRLTLISRRPW
jgi:hypothetical protein